MLLISNERVGLTLVAPVIHDIIKSLTTCLTSWISQSIESSFLSKEKTAVNAEDPDAIFLSQKHTRKNYSVIFHYDA